MARKETSSTIFCINRQAEGVRIRAAAAAQLLCTKYKIPDSEFETVETVITLAMSMPLFQREIKS